MPFAAPHSPERPLTADGRRNCGSICTASIWRGWVDSDDVLGFFDDRGEQEIVTDHVYGVEKIAELVIAKLVPVEEAS